MKPSVRKVVLLGPQGLVPDVGSVLAELGVRNKVALVRAASSILSSRTR